jgi:hypothetical protein
MTPTTVNALNTCQRVNFISLPPRVLPVPTRDSGLNKESFSSPGLIFFNQIAAEREYSVVDLFCCIGRGCAQTKGAHKISCCSMHCISSRISVDLIRCSAQPIEKIALQIPASLRRDVAQPKSHNLRDVFYWRSTGCAGSLKSATRRDADIDAKKSRAGYFPSRSCRLSCFATAASVLFKPKRGPI